VEGAVNTIALLLNAREAVMSLGVMNAPFTTSGVW
jgi:hypothetical protein